MYKVTSDNIRKVAMDLYYCFSEEQIHFKNGKLLPDDAVWYRELSPSSLQHIKEIGGKSRKVKDFS